MSALSIQGLCVEVPGPHGGVRVVDGVDLEVPPGRTVPISSEMSLPLWNRWEFLLLLTALLAMEWISRKRAGLV
jgi:hypothetical protein